MDAVELDRRFDSADPAASVMGSPLNARALADLQAITTDAYVPRLQRTARHKSRSRRLFVLAAITGALVAVIVLVRVVIPVPGQAYAATPPLLHASGPVLSVSTVLDRSIQRLGTSHGLPATALRQSRYEAWFANITFGTDNDVATAAAVSPEEDSFSWASDLSGR